MTKHYQLVLWTEHGHLRSLPSIVEELAEDYRRRIERLERINPDSFDAEIEHTMRLSQAYENLGELYCRFGHWEQAFEQFVQGAEVCVNCSDFFWCEGEYAFSLCKPFSSRFFRMYGKCCKLISKHPWLSLSEKKKDLDESFESVIEDNETRHAESDRAWEDNMAFYFGKNAAKGV